MTEAREYKVTLRFQFPYWDEKDGLEYFVTATSKSDAIAQARRIAERDGNYGHGSGIGKGRSTFKAEIADEPAAGLRR